MLLLLGWSCADDGLWICWLFYFVLFVCLILVNRATALRIHHDWTTTAAATATVITTTTTWTTKLTRKLWERTVRWVAAVRIHRPVTDHFSLTLWRCSTTNWIKVRCCRWPSTPRSTKLNAQAEADTGNWTGARASPWIPSAAEWFRPTRAATRRNCVDLTKRTERASTEINVSLLTECTNCAVWCVIPSTRRNCAAPSTRSDSALTVRAATSSTTRKRPASTTATSTTCETQPQLPPLPLPPPPLLPAPALLPLKQAAIPETNSSRRCRVDQRPIHRRHRRRSASRLRLWTLSSPTICSIRPIRFHRRPPEAELTTPSSSDQTLCRRSLRQHDLPDFQRRNSAVLARFRNWVSSTHPWALTAAITTTSTTFTTTTTTIISSGWTTWRNWTTLHRRWIRCRRISTRSVFPRPVRLLLRRPPPPCDCPSSAASLKLSMRINSGDHLTTIIIISFTL